MKKLILGSVLAGLGYGLMMGGALALDDPADEDFQASCEAYVEAYEANELDCSCLTAATEEEPALLEEFAKVQKPEDADLMNDDAKEAVALCTAE